MYQQGSPKIPEGAHHHQKANTRKYALKQHWYYTGNTKNQTYDICSEVIQICCTKNMEFIPKTNKRMQQP